MKTDTIDAALAIISQVCDDHIPVKVFALFSGGHDSLCATHVASQHPSFSGVVHVNTGIGIEQTRDFVRKTCESYGWPLIEKHPPQKQYADLVQEYGFPGPAAHRFMYVWLKERAIAELVRENKTHRKDRVALVTGVRLSESKRRMGHVKPIQRDNARVWVAPILDWTNEDKTAYMEVNGLPRNEVVDILHMSGECLCGAYAEKGELNLIEVFFPDAAKQIKELPNRFPWGWGEGGPPDAWKQFQSGQLSMFPLFEEDEKGNMMLCHTCEARKEQRT